MRLHRRDLLTSLLASVTPLAAQTQRQAIDEQDPANIKIAHRLDAKGLSDSDLLFLQQIGLRWARLEFGEGESTFDILRAARDRFARFGMKIYSGVHYSYRSPVLQLGQPGVTSTSRLTAISCAIWASWKSPSHPTTSIRRTLTRPTWCSGAGILHANLI